MIINNAPVNEAIVSNVGQIGEFRIRNSAKAFNILSSGLYANKIRAIIRELSCNAVDSHVAAGKQNTPFDVHLPNQLEPHFSIRDYGTGLNHEQVTNIYTTYFESTKTNSNEFIGALGLGSKSPFSYTDNFTVTAIQNNKKGIYTAFINEQGVPSIALMMEEDTTDPNGVEVKFSVNDRYDFDKFRQEARHVYKYFKLRPVISGGNELSIEQITYQDKNIIPGVHFSKDSHSSIAIMGNIAYPIDIPKSDNTLGDLRGLLGCGLTMEFNIGELDFQASREGLSYIPQTVQSIKNKLEKLNSQLTIRLAEEANKIENLWERADFLMKRSGQSLWSSAVLKYVTNTKFELVHNDRNYIRSKVFEFVVDDLAKDYNIVIRSFSKQTYTNACSNRKVENVYGDKNTNGNYTIIPTWKISVGSGIHFVVNDTKVGALERAKAHYRANSKVNATVFVIEPSDRNKPVKVDDFFKTLVNPPESQIFKASELDKQDRAAGMGKNVTIMRLEERGNGGSYRRYDMVWRDAGKSDTFSDTVTYYYLPLSGFICLGKFGEVKQLSNHLTTSGVYTGQIYGVRKTDIEEIKKKKNWVNLDTYIADKLSKMDQANIMGLVKQAIDRNDMFEYNVVNLVNNSSSPYSKFISQFKDVQAIDSRKQVSLERLCREYDIKSNVSPSAIIDKYKAELKTIEERYPLMNYVSMYKGSAQMALADYIKLVDSIKGV